ncbi:MAG: CHASE2 domain-containing protein [Deltaproteobacteria bacterium]|nr:MAG: CHASE2 domain-containing protein [Deltaproteobacteria bacterium]
MLKKIFKSNNFFGIVPLFFTMFFIIILVQYSFISLEAMFYDFKIKWDLGTKFKDSIIIINIDEESDQFLGEKYPYTYASHLRLFKRLSEGKPKIINYFVNLLDPESIREQNNLVRLRNEIEKFIKNKGVFRFATYEDEWGEYLPPVELQSFGHSIARLKHAPANLAKDDIVRSVPLIHHGEPSIHLWTANKYRSYEGKGPLEIKNIQGAFYVREDDTTFALFRYSTTPVEGKSKIKNIPFHQVVVGDYPEDFFKNKIVLIGPTYLSNRDNFVMTPFNRESYEATRMNVHAERIHSLLQNKTVYRISRQISTLLSILMAVFLSFAISRLRPTTGLFIIISIMVALVLLSYLIFVMFGYWLYTIHLILSVFIVYYIWIPFRAIGEYQQRFAIEEEAKLLKKVENLKQNFISLMSHDLKTPMAKITGIAENMLQRGPGDPNFDRNLDSIITSTSDLNNFISSILDLTKIESRKLVLSKTSIDITQIIESSVENIEKDPHYKEVDFNLELAPLYPIQVDALLIRRVVHNLVENAIKYSGERPQIKIKTWDDPNFVYITISDKGVGIAPDDLDHVFDKFYRVKNDASHTIKGTGLGLYLVKYFVELHGGSISVESTLGKGTAFKIKLVNA